MTPGAVTVCGSISRHPVSLGRVMHEAGYRTLGLAYVYAPFGVGDLPAAIAGVRALGLRGVGVSMPFKIEILPLLDELSPLARRIGAVNTVVNDAGHLRGENTDAAGAVNALGEVASARGRKALVIGAGGAARAVVFGLLDAGADVTVVNRTDARALALAADAGARAARWAEREAHAARCDIVVNASSAGMTDVSPRPPFDPSCLAAGQVVLDAVYKPIETQFVHGARAAGASVVVGTRMLLHQAMAQFALYTGKEPPREAMERALEAEIAR